MQLSFGFLLVEIKRLVQEKETRERNTEYCSRLVAVLLIFWHRFEEPQNMFFKEKYK